MKYRKIIIIAVLSAACLSFAYGMDRRDEAKLGMALSYMGLQKYEEAAELLAELKEAYPDDENVRFELAKTLGYMGNLSESGELFDSLPPEREILLAHASVLEANGEFSRAAEKYETLLKLHPGDLDIMEKLADVSAWGGDLDAAGYYYSEILSVKPDKRGVAVKYADVLLRREEYSEALEIYKDAGISMEEDRQRYKNMGEAYIGAGEYGEAAKIFKKITDKYPESTGARINLADAYFGLGEEKKAEEQIGIVTALEPDGKTRRRLAEILASHGKYERAADMLEGLPEEMPRDYTFLEFAADVYLGAGRLEKSEALYRRLLEAGHKPGEISIKLADVLRYRGKHEEAIEIYRKYIDE